MCRLIDRGYTPVKGTSGQMFVLLKPGTGSTDGIVSAAATASTVKTGLTPCGQARQIVYTDPR